MQRAPARFAALAAGMLAVLAATSSCNSAKQSVDEVPRLLRGRWVVAELEGLDIEALEKSGSKLPFILIDTEGQVSGYGGVNRIGSTLDLDVLGGGQFRLTPITTTMMAAEPDLMARELKFTQALQDARAFRFNGDRLELLDKWAKDEDELGDIVIVLKRMQ
jgi:heat shock protein HslJ